MATCAQQLPCAEKRIDALDFVWFSLGWCGTSGYDPRLSVFTVYSHKWSPGDEIEAGYDMPVRLLRPHARLKGHSGKVAVRRGPLVYCLEGVDHAGLDIFSARLDPDSLASVFDGSLLDGITRIDGRTTDGKPLIFIPYFLWGNRGPSQMTVWVNT